MNVFLLIGCLGAVLVVVAVVLWVRQHRAPQLWEARVEAGMAAIEAKIGRVLPLRSVPLDLIATAVAKTVTDPPRCSAVELEAAILAVIKRNSFPEITVLQ